MNHLLTGDQQVIPALLEQQADALSILQQRHALKLQKVQPLLTQLGAETYSDRVQATQALSGMGASIREEVIAFQKANASDPEINMRCKKILTNLLKTDTPEGDVSVVQFLMACDEVDPSIILQEQDRYTRIFERQDEAIFQSKNPQDHLEEFYRFTHQYLSIPGTREPFMAWLLTDQNRARVIGTLRMLLFEDFSSYYPLVNSENRHSYYIDQLVEKEFRGKMSEQDLTLKLKRIYDQPREAPEVAFDPLAPITPVLAYQLMNREGMKNLGDTLYEFLFEKMSPLTTDELLDLMNRQTLQGFFLQQLAKRRPDLHTALPDFILNQLNEIEYIWLWDLYAMVLIDSLQYEPERGEIDLAWERVYEIRNGAETVLAWRVEKLNLSPKIIISTFQKHASNIEKDFSDYSTALSYVLKNGDADTRAQCIDLLFGFSTFEALYYPKFSELWYALIAHPDADRQGLLAKKIAIMDKLKSKQSSLFLPQAMNESYELDRSNLLLNFYHENQTNLNHLFTQTPFSPGTIQLACLLSKNPELPAQTRALLFQKLESALHSDTLSSENQEAILIAGLHQEEIPTETWFNALLEFVCAEQDDLFDFPLWKIGPRFRVFLPQLETRLSQPNAPQIPLLSLGLLIDAHNPAWQDPIDQQLQHQAHPEQLATLIKALIIVNQEPDLSPFNPDRLTQLFAASTKEKYKQIAELFATFDTSQNKLTALRYLHPQFPEMFSSGYGIYKLSDLYYDNPKSWELAGPSLMKLLTSPSPKVINAVCSNLTGFDKLPSSALPQLESLLFSPTVTSSTKNSLLWVIAKMGQEASALTDQVRALPVRAGTMTYRKAFCLASISPDPAERLQNLLFLQQSYETDPEKTTLRQIGLLREFDQERLSFFQSLLAKAFTSEDPEIPVYHLKEILYRFANFKDPEIALQQYHQLLEELADPEFSRAKLYELSAPIFSRLQSTYPDHIQEFNAVIDALPPACKQSIHYRSIMERMDAPLVAE
ncbi:hypothetical protein P3T73_03805 [Kiritimatiellota bacterium B12222]|nr:hypothetical protein P3T73_03805 [Kiritimatiellota bacterium B12222]